MSKLDSDMGEGGLVVCLHFSHGTKSKWAYRVVLSIQDREQISSLSIQPQTRYLKAARTHRFLGL